jgi:hypothetical protein
MSQNPCIIILTYPNTESKINILLKSIKSVKKLGIPILVFSNMDIDKKYLSDADEFIFTGENLMASASDYLSIDNITLARNTTKYRFHLEYDNNIITYIPITYGTEKSYYCAVIKLYQKSFEFAYNKGYTHFMLLQELELNDENIKLSKNYLNETQASNLDGIFSVDPNMGENHLSDYVFFGKTKWWKELFQTASSEEFYNLTFPNWSVEEYFYKKCKEKQGNIKFKVRTNLEEWEKKYYCEFPPSWVKDEIDCLTRQPFNLFYPNLISTDSSNNWETPYFDIEKTLIVSILPLKPFNSEYQIFVWNRSISEYDRKISVKITFPPDDETHSKIDDIDLELQPGVWNFKNILDNIKGRKVIIEYSYIEDNKLISNFDTYYL